MKSRLLIILFFITHQLFSQEFSREFGRISQNEIDLKSDEKDPEAGAVILFDMGESIFFDTESGYDIRFTRTKRMKIFDQTAIENAEVSIPFYVDGYGKTETIKSIEAFTYNIEEGRLIKKALDQSTIFEERISERWREKKFVFPDVREGSIFEFKYVLETPFHFNLPDWTFQDKIPTIYSQYRVRMIPFYEYVFLVQGISRFDYQKSEVAKEKRTWGSVIKDHGRNVGSGVEFQDYVHTYALKNIPAFKDESYITSINDYIIKMDFQLAKFHSPTGGSNNIISTWPELNKALLKHEKFGKYLKSCNRFVKKVFEADINLEGKTEKEKSEIIVDYVKSNFSWNGFNSKYTSKSAKEFFTQKTGNSADINLFLTALFDYAGFEAHPLILSTRNHGKIKTDYPFDHFFNYTVTFVNSKQPFLADGTENYLSYNRIPPRCINEKGLLVKDDDVNWFGLNNNVVSWENRQININVDAENLNSKITATFYTTEYVAYYYKQKYRNDTTAIKNFLLNSNINKINRIETFNYDNTNRPYIISFEGKAEIEKIGSNLIISPFLNLAITENRLTQKTRSYPVDFMYSNAEQFNITIDVPSGYKITNLPESYSMNNDLAEIKLDYQNRESILEINARYTFKKSIYQTNEYARIRFYFDTIVKKFNEQIVFEKDN